MFGQPTLGPPSSSSVQRSVDFGQVLEEEKVTVRVEWGRVRPEDSPPSPLSSNTPPLCSPLSPSLFQPLSQQTPRGCLPGAVTEISNDRGIPGLYQGVDSDQAGTAHGQRQG